MLSEFVQRQSRFVRSRTGAGAVPAPPFHKVAVDVLWVGFHIDPEAVRPFVPEPLFLTEASIGMLGIYQAPTGSGLAPYQRALVAVSVEGREGTNIGEGMYVLGNIMDEPGGERMRALYSNPTFAGTARTWTEDGLLCGEAQVAGVSWLRARVRPTGAVQKDRTGVDTFFGLGPSGLVQNVDSNISDIVDAEAVSVEIDAAAPPFMRALRPRGVVFALHALKVNSVWTEPRRVGQSGDPASDVFLDLIEETGRAAAIVRPDGSLWAVNESGRKLLGRAHARPGQPLLSGTAAERQALRLALDMSFKRLGPRVTDPVTLTRHDGGILLAHVLPLDHGMSPDRALVLLADPHGPERHDATRLLQLLGLTQAEARLAALIGSGQDTREAALHLSISPLTARSTMKAVYDKLGIRKQSELGHFVARLQHF